MKEIIISFNRGRDGDLVNISFKVIGDMTNNPNFPNPNPRNSHWAGRTIGILAHCTTVYSVVAGSNTFAQCASGFGGTFLLHVICIFKGGKETDIYHWSWKQEG